MSSASIVLPEAQCLGRSLAWAQRARDGCGDLTKTEEAVLDLAGVGMTVAKVVEVIPESESEIRRAIVGLIDQELISTSA